jgi:ABC-type Fe3+ transport system permease subunit
VMMGSAVPLHLAQVPTYAIKVWLDLTLAPGSWRVWLAAWPLLVFACGGAFIIAMAVARQAGRPDEASIRADRRAGASGFGAVSVWLAAVALPLGLFVWTASGLRPYTQFWAASSGALGASAGIGAAVGVLGVLLAGAFWQGQSAARAGSPSLVLRACLVLLMLMGLLPGVLAGSAVSTAINITPGAYDLGESPLAVVLAHVGRFGFVAALVGCWLAAVEPRQERDLRALDAGLGLRSWWAVCLPVQGGALAGAGLAMAALSLHEIEAAVMVQPPGSPSLAQVMLNHLHQLRMQDVAAAAVVVVLMGLIVAWMAAWSVRRTIRRTA